jgi:hypothetical protein
MTEQELAAINAGKAGAPKPDKKPDKKSNLTARNAEQIQDATRVQIESLTDAMQSQMVDAVVSRAAEKVALGTLQRTDEVVEKAIGHLQSFLPRLLEKDQLMVESEFDKFMMNEAA